MNWVRLNLVVEGQTEETFVKSLLAPQLGRSSIAVSARMVSHGKLRSRNHKGGLTRFEDLRNDLARWMREDRSAEARFTTMVDLYAYPDDAPGFNEARDLPPFEKVARLEQGFSDSLGDVRFIPYIQVHEFETILFSDLGKWPAAFPGRAAAIKALADSVCTFENVELINDGPDTAPSKRILKHLPEYQKVVAGNVLALEIGLPAIRARCSHFDGWIKKLELICPNH